MPVAGGLTVTDPGPSIKTVRSYLSINVAVTNLLVVVIAKPHHLLVPGPPVVSHPVKDAIPKSGFPVRVIVEPAGKSAVEVALHGEPQFMPKGLLAIPPVPCEESGTTIKVYTGINVAVTYVIVLVPEGRTSGHVGSDPEHALPQNWNAPPTFGRAVNVTVGLLVVGVHSVVSHTLSPGPNTSPYAGLTIPTTIVCVYSAPVLASRAFFSKITNVNNAPATKIAIAPVTIKTSKTVKHFLPFFISSVYHITSTI